MDIEENVHVKRLNEVFSVFTMEQIVKEPTHNNGHTLDIVAYSDQMQISGVTVIDKTTSDHYAVFFDICNYAAPTVSVTPNKQLRNVKRINMSAFTLDVDSAVSVVLYSSVDVAANGINTALVRCLDKHAPLTNYKQRTRPSDEWMNKDISILF